MKESPTALRDDGKLKFADRKLIGFTSSLEHVDDVAKVEITPEMLISGKARVKGGASITRYKITGEDRTDHQPAC